MNRILEAAPNHKILIIGDALLDHYFYGTVDRICPEAPVPIINVTEERWCPGGALNASANVEALGSRVHLIHSTKASLKHRVIGNDHQLARYDQDEEETRPVKEVMDLGLYSAILISDYGKGMITKELIDFLSTVSAPIIVDPYVPHWSWYVGHHITPNQKQWKEMNVDSGLFRSVLLTKGEEGMRLRADDRTGSSYVVSGLNVPVKSAVGAGDVAAAAYAVALATSASCEEAAEFANICAGVAVQYRGTCVTRKEEVEKWTKQDQSQT